MFNCLLISKFFVDFQITLCWYFHLRVSPDKSSLWQRKAFYAKLQSAVHTLLDTVKEEVTHAIGEPCFFTMTQSISSWTVTSAQLIDFSTHFVPFSPDFSTPVCHLPAHLREKKAALLVHLDASIKATHHMNSGAVMRLFNTEAWGHGDARAEGKASIIW